MIRLSELRAEISRQITPRIAYGLTALFAIGAFVGVSEIATRADMLEADAADMQAELAVLRDANSAALWQTRAATAGAARDAWEMRDWEAATPGIASAEIQAAVAAIGAEAGLLDSRIQVTGDPTDLNGRRVLRFEMTGIGEPRAFIRSLTAISTSPRRLIVNEITTQFNQGGQQGRIFIAGYAPYRGAAADENPQTAGGGP